MLNKIQLKKIEDSYDILRLASEMSKTYYQKPLVLTYSGGKDSDVLLQLAIECLNPEDFEVLNSHTSVDAPETVWYIRDKFKELNAMGIKASVQIPRYKDGRQKTIWNLIDSHSMPPTRLARYCCDELKETSTPNRFIALGVRESESTNRRGRDVFAIKTSSKKTGHFYDLDHVKDVFTDAERERERVGAEPNDYSVYDCKFIENAKKKKDLMCNPIYKWLDSDVWDFIHDRQMKYNPLYDMGYLRVGCVGCPMSTRKRQELNRYPKYKLNYIKAFDRMLKNNKGKKTQARKWENAEDVYRWWIEDDQIPGQLTLDGTEYLP